LLVKNLRKTVPGYCFFPHALFGINAFDFPERVRLTSDYQNTFSCSMFVIAIGHFMVAEYRIRDVVSAKRDGIGHQPIKCKLIIKTNLVDIYTNRSHLAGLVFPHSETFTISTYTTARIANLRTHE